jgi:hypothetical protein
MGLYLDWLCKRNVALKTVRFFLLLSISSKKTLI